MRFSNFLKVFATKSLDQSIKVFKAKLVKFVTNFSNFPICVILLISKQWFKILAKKNKTFGFIDFFGFFSTSFITGKPLHGNVVRDTNNRWYLNESDYPCPDFLPYFNGAVYTLSYAAVHSLCTLGRMFEAIFIEDAFLSILATLAYVEKVTLPEEHRFSHHCPEIFRNFFLGFLIY